MANDVQAKTDSEISRGYTGAVGVVEKTIETLDALRDNLRRQAVQVAEAGEERRREQDKALYDIGRARQAELDRQAAEDREREAEFEKRRRALADAEEELCGLLKVGGGPEDPVPGPKVIREAFAARLGEAEKAATGRAEAVAKAAYETAKRIDTAEASKVNALLTQENETLKKANASLADQNAKLLAAQASTVADMKEVASGAFAAAGGVVAAGNSALSTAAGSGFARPPRG